MYIVGLPTLTVEKETQIVADIEAQSKHTQNTGGTHNTVTGNREDGELLGQEKENETGDPHRDQRRGQEIQRRVITERAEEGEDSQKVAEVELGENPNQENLEEAHEQARDFEEKRETERVFSEAFADAFLVQKDKRIHWTKGWNGTDFQGGDMQERPREPSNLRIWTQNVNSLRATRRIYALAKK